MAKIGFLIGEAEVVTEGNCLYFTNVLIARGDAVFLCLVESLSLHKSLIKARAAAVETPLQAGQSLADLNFQPTPLDDMDLVWLLALGYRTTFLDKIQLLYNLSTKVRIVNSVDAIMYLKSKYLLSHNDLFSYPESYASNDWEYLWEIISTEGGKWILKPPAGSFGRDVFVVGPQQSNTRALLQNMTAHGTGQYCLMQRYVEEIAEGEKRVLFAGGQAVGQYKRRAGTDHRTNVIQGARTEACDLSDREIDLCREIGRYLVGMGAEFAGVDMVFPYVIEFNVINPGGLHTIQELTGVNLAIEVINLILGE
jgi:glutathione synthase|tara:strand:+ start:7190 stop:8119 length:930 start_codon:yes stop_codon:yes gene_type:complete